MTVHRLRTSQGVKPPQPQQLWRYALIEEMKEEEYGFRRFGIRKPQLIHNGSIVGTHGHSSDTDYTAYIQAMNIATIDIETLAEFLGRHRRIAVLTGAGISLAAGIPTYRDEHGNRLNSEPIKHQEFLADPAQRQRYWSRSFRGWPAVSSAQPTRAHKTLTQFQSAGHIDTIITQNVDRLHQRAGSQRVTDLHGRLDHVLCLGCNAVHHRDEIQTQLHLHNGPAAAVANNRPDGDADLDASVARQFIVPNCPICDGILMPDVVFFGGTVPAQRVKHCMNAIEQADALLAIGSSLQVFSGFRFCRKASQLGKPLLIINPGTTRADDLAQLKLGTDCQDLLDNTYKTLY